MRSWQDRKQNAVIETGDGTLFNIEYKDVSSKRD